MSAILILGGGFGGLACARALRDRLGREHRVVLIDRSPIFTVGAAKTWVMLGERAPDQVTRPRAALLPDGVELLGEDILSIDPAARRVKTDRGVHEADHLVLALGAERDMGSIAGLEAAALTFYTLEGASQAHRALEAFRGGSILLLIPRIPFPCPPAPYEAAFLLHERLERSGLRDQTRLDVWTVEPAPMPTAGPGMGAAIVSELAARGIGFHPRARASSVEGARRAVRFEDGSEAAYDLLLAVPPHRVPRILADAGLAEPSGWVRVDPATLEVKKEGVADVYAIGDAAGVPLPGRYDPATPLALPKAGVFAAAQGEVAAARIAARVRGRDPDAAFDGQGFCYIEVGEGRAMRAEGEFFAKPHPVMTPHAPDRAQLHDKIAWVEGWLAEVRASDS